MSNTIPYRSPGTMGTVEKPKPGSLYDGDNRYTEAAQDLSEQAHAVLRPIFRSFFNNGYSPREIAHILQSVASDLELGSVL